MRTFPCFLLTFMMALLLVPSAAATPYLPDGPTKLAADVVVEAEQVSWLPREAYEQVQLTVIGPHGVELRRIFEGGAVPVLHFSEAYLPDGDYTYEVLMLNEATEAEYAAVELSEELKAEGARVMHSTKQIGAFAVAQAALQPVIEVVPSVFFFTVLTSADGVIRNSLCVGFDCPNSPSFSDTTILLMENNTRIKFDDTSSTASFPNNDWELEANSSLNGGSNRFALNDCGTSSQGGCADDPVFVVEAGARANALFVDDGGRIGVGTSTPAIRGVHIKFGDTPTVRLEQDNSSGFTPQTWDVAGNETNFFIRDATGGSALPFRIQPGAASNTLFLSSDEEVGIGTSAPEEKLHIRTTGDVQTEALIENTFSGSGKRVSLALRNTQGGGQEWEMAIKGNGDLQFFDRTTSNERMTIARTTGDVNIPGNLSKGGGSFRIDHPLDPANQYLSHSFVESPDMMNVYNGNVTTDERGEAVVVLPAYFEVLNRDFRYQLTVIGTFAQAIVAEKVQGNRFMIRTDKPGVEVSWQVTGVRQDPWAEAHRIEVEEAKPEGERGTFLHPEVYKD